MLCPACSVGGKPGSNSEVDSISPLWCNIVIMTAYSQTTELELIGLLEEDIFELSGALERVAELIARREGQTHARWQVLKAAASGDETVSQLARRVGRVRQSVQRVADILVDEGLVAYTENPDHKRSPLVGLTRAGSRVLGRLTKRSRRFYGLVAKKTTKRGLGDLRRSVRDLADIVGSLERS